MLPARIVLISIFALVHAGNAIAQRGATASGYMTHGGYNSGIGISTGPGISSGPGITASGYNASGYMINGGYTGPGSTNGSGGYTAGNANIAPVGSIMGGNNSAAPTAPIIERPTFSSDFSGADNSSQIGTGSIPPPLSGRLALTPIETSPAPPSAPAGGYSSGTEITAGPGIKSGPGISGYNSGTGISTGPGIESGAGINGGAGIKSGAGIIASGYNSGTGIPATPGPTASGYSSGTLSSGISISAHPGTIESAPLPPISSFSTESRKTTSTESTTNNKTESSVTAGGLSNFFGAVRSALNPANLYSVSSNSIASTPINTLNTLPPTGSSGIANTTPGAVSNQLQPSASKDGVIIGEAKKLYGSVPIQAYNLGKDGGKCAAGAVGAIVAPEIEPLTLGAAAYYCYGAGSSAKGLGGALSK